MSSLNFPDPNLWLALAVEDHLHHKTAIQWWKQESGQIAFIRHSQLGLLRLLTTSAAMGGKPLSMTQAWRVYDRFYQDDRVLLHPEPHLLDKHFRKQASGKFASPKLWADAWMLAFAEAAGGQLVTFDNALTVYGATLLQ